MTTADVAAWRERCARAGQQHLIAAWERLDAPGRERLGTQIEQLDFELLDSLRALLADPPAHEAATSIEPPELFQLGRTDGPEARAARERGEELFAGGKVGYLLVAGGQASRLGYDAPKGVFPIGPVTGRSLFAFHAARILAARERYGAAAPWYVMTSPANDAATRAYFDEEGYFGLDPDDVVFFSQATNPALDEEGRVLMKAPDELFLAPNGHGGVLLALAASGALDDAKLRGVELLSYFQVDNPLVRPADPLFVGLHDQAAAGMSSKVVAKRDASEKVGVLGRLDGEMGCIEYSDLPDELREARDADGELQFRAGNIAVHVLGRDFIDQVTRGPLHLPWHLARKRMQVWSEAGEVEVWGTKFETFVFDALGRSRTSVTLEVDRAREFSPVKNASGLDSPQTARHDLCKLFAGWVEAKGFELPEPDGEGLHPVEVWPRLAEDERSFVALDAVTPRVTEAGHLYE